MSYWMGTTVAKTKGRREQRREPRTPMTLEQRRVNEKRLRRKRAERMAARRINYYTHPQ